MKGYMGLGPETVRSLVPDVRWVTVVRWIMGVRTSGSFRTSAGSGSVEVAPDFQRWPYVQSRRTSADSSRDRWYRISGKRRTSGA